MEQLFLKYAADLLAAADEEALNKEWNESFKDILLRIRTKLEEAGLPSQIGVAPLLMDFCVSKDVELAYHRNYRVELYSRTTGERYYGPVMTPKNFVILAERLIENGE